VTFDDGQRDNFVHARPVLARYGVPATFFVSAANVSSGEPLWHDRIAFAVAKLVEQLGADADDVVRGIFGANREEMSPSPDFSSSLARWAVARAKTLALDARDEAIQRLCSRVDGPLVPEWDGIMSWEELRTLKAEGHEIGSHAMTHALLLDTQGCDQRWEVAESKHVIEREIGVPIRTFCYPNGSYDRTTLRELQAAGYDCAVTTQWGSNRRGTSPFELRRFDIQAERNRSSSGHVSHPVLAWRLADLRIGRDRT
jgi:peptidoglycan/xylan/chitin deacetylase (PgdA/CDA1 family)